VWGWAWGHAGLAHGDALGCEGGCRTWEGAGARAVRRGAPRASECAVRRRAGAASVVRRGGMMEAEPGGGAGAHAVTHGARGKLDAWDRMVRRRGGGSQGVGDPAERGGGGGARGFDRSGVARARGLGRSVGWVQGIDLPVYYPR
jgi:hypothetical protein